MGISIPKEFDGTGIYIISIENYYYVGSSVDFRKRLNKHFNLLRQGKHFNRKFQSVFDKYGEDKVSIRILERCSKELLLETEQFWLDTLFRFEKSSINSARNAESGMLGKSHSEETKQKMKLVQQGKFNLNAEQKSRQLAAMKGNKNGSGNKGRKYSERELTNRSIEPFYLLNITSGELFRVVRVSEFCIENGIKTKDSIHALKHRTKEKYLDWRLYDY